MSVLCEVPHQSRSLLVITTASSLEAKQARRDTSSGGRPVLGRDALQRHQTLIEVGNVAVRPISKALGP